ncbi:classical arabinogalactan protein 7 [Chelmon rostratus]|uniref:classical arabinogalactan protein 7 n=1 Tax=Chelmon rostratus TaxID=109905 RepID=UPI001BE7512E|nr:classical arabinogalactan protein 7 [Chelmon rostratus]
MNVQLLLLVALVGPFCAYTHASPTAVPTESDVGVTHFLADVTAEATESAIDDLTVVTGPPPTDPVAAPEQLTTEDAPLAAASPALSTEEPVAETEAPTAVPTPAPEPFNTDSPAVETAAPSDATVAEVQPEVTAGEPSEGVVVEEGENENLTSGQVVGIVIGALLAVVIVIAVVIAAVRRMGKYSP